MAQTGIFIGQDPNPAPGSGSEVDQKERFKKLEATVKLAKQARQTWEGMWEDVFTYVFPGRGGFFEKTEGQSFTDLIFDETAIDETPKFVSRIVEGMFPPNNRAFSLKPHPRSKLAKDRKLIARLQDETEMYHEILRNSNFYTELYPAITDLAVGTMTMAIDPGPLPGEIITKAIPLPQLYLLRGPFGEPDAWLRIRKVKVGDLTRVWKKAVLSQKLRMDVRKDPEKEVTVWEAVVRIRDRSSEVKYEELIGVEDTKELIFGRRFEGRGSNRYLTSRWFTDAGETFGRGVLINVLPAIKTANLVVEMTLENGQMNIGGAFVYDNDGVFNFDNVTIEPGTFIPRAPGSQIDELQSSSRFDLGNLVLDEMRLNIRRALFSPTPDRPQGRTPPSATEIAEERAENARNMGSAVTRLQYEFMKPLVDRLQFILKQQGITETTKVDGKEIVLVPESPLMRSQDQQDIADFMRYAESLQFVMGPAAGGALQPAQTVQFLAEKFRIDSSLVPGEDEINQRAQNALAQAQQAQQV